MSPVISLESVQQQALQLSPADRQVLIQVLTRSLQSEAPSSSRSPEEIGAAIDRLRGIAKTDHPPTDAEVRAMLEARRNALAELPQICAEENYVLEVPERIDRLQ